ncbi:DUF1659 domain-containing protein [Aquisalibacillus elongatus]|uniref:Uncharacterized protein DUF1659 n=1 Tax=Aquisalibacillus elongatus TaxID=485577 RepID=A0A3N5B5A0_9BACI|nr:DUF1659 domain-containing protein [Aquisalibacillus elongatus]RPF52279.1 uncharacterized protein DUF1659 [Aquisalibacillus elongatus]
MATQVKTRTQLQLMFDAGIGEDGKNIIKRRSFNQVKMDTTADQLYAVSDALASLQEHALVNIVRNDSFDVNEL